MKASTFTVAQKQFILKDVKQRINLLVDTEIEILGHQNPSWLDSQTDILKGATS